MRRFYQRYTFVDYATLVYMAGVGLLVLFFHNHTVPHWPALVAAHLAGILGLNGLLYWHDRQPENRFIDFLRHFYPVPCFLWSADGRLTK